MKGIIFYSFLTLVIFAILVADYSFLPLMVVIFVFPLIWKMFSNMTEQQVYNNLGISWLVKKFNNSIIKDFMRE